MEPNSGINKHRVREGLLRMQYQLRTLILSRAISRILVFLLIATCSQSIYTAEAATGDPGSIEFTRNADTFGGEGGKSNWVTYPDNANTELGSSDFTIEFWAKFKSFAEQGAIIAKTSQFAAYSETAWMFLINGSNIPEFRYTSTASYNNGVSPNWGSGDGADFGSVNPGTAWHHYAVTRTGNTFRLFLDGVFQSKFTETGSIYNNSQPIFLGGWPTSNGSHGFNGFISRLHIAVGSGASLYSSDSNFTPSLYEITPIATTQLLVASDQGASFLTDSSRNALVATPQASDRANVTSSTNVPTGFVNRTAQTISFPDLSSITLGGAAPTPAATASSNLTVAYNSATASVCTVTGSTISVLTIGTCTINANQAGNGTYSPATQVQKSFLIGNSQTITFSDLSPITIGGVAPTLTATSSSNLTVAFTSATTAVCTVTGTTITVLTTGTCTINANQAGNATYAAAVQVQKSFVISPVPVVDDVAAVAAAAAAAAKRAAEQKELTEILALIPKIAELTLSLGETTKSLYQQKCIKGKTIKYVKNGSKCPKGYVAFKKSKPMGS